MDSDSSAVPPQPISFSPDDMIDAPFGPNQFIVWDETKSGYIDLFHWAEHTVADDLLLTDEPRHRWLESKGFERDDSMSAYSHSITPCPICHSDGHALFARWGEGYPAPDYFDQKTREKPSWTPPGVVPPSDATDDTPPQEEEDFDPPPEGEPRWVRVRSIAELKLLPLRGRPSLRRDRIRIPRT